MKKIIIILISFILPGITHAHQCKYYFNLLNQLEIQIDVAAENIANADTTSSNDGNPYRKKLVFCHESDCEITSEDSFIDRYQPGHPQANAEGHVLFPKINVTSEMALLIGLQHTYESILNIMNVKNCTLAMR